MRTNQVSAFEVGQLYTNDQIRFSLEVENLGGIRPALDGQGNVRHVAVLKSDEIADRARQGEFQAVPQFRRYMGIHYSGVKGNVAQMISPGRRQGTLRARRVVADSDVCVKDLHVHNGD